MQENTSRKTDLKNKFIKVIESIDRSKSRYQIFDDFLTLAYCAISKAALLGDYRAAEETEKRYMQVIGAYSEKSDRLKFSELLAILTEGLEEPCDFLGEVAGEKEMLDARLGQFFTPYHLCRTMAKITVSDIKKQLETKKFITVQEPAVGAGAMVLAIFDELKEQGVNPQQVMWVDATDLSEVAYKMAYIQFSLKGVSGVVRHGNSLSLETYELRKTILGTMFILRHKNPYTNQVKINTTLLKKKFAPEILKNRKFKSGGKLRKSKIFEK